MITILGGGESGVGAAMLAVQKGFDVFVSDYGSISSDYKLTLEELNISYEENNHSEAKILSSELVIKSPGIPQNAPIITKIRNSNILIIGELEWAFRYCLGKIIAITGSNGKTTVTNLITHLLEVANQSVTKCGNVGDSFAKLVSMTVSDYYVVEVSSFQLEDIVEFNPEIAILTNISPDHLDRYHGKLKEYALTKLKITERQSHNQYLVLGNVDEWTLNLIKNKNITAKVVLTDHERNGELELNGHIIKYDNMFLKGKHNAANVACAISIMKILKIDFEDVELGLNNFINDPHRMEWVQEMDGVNWINDSKATNVDATYFALESQSRPVIWIVGGTDKGNEYGALDELVKKKVKAIICLGVDNSKLIDHFESYSATLIDTNNIEDAVLEANNIASRGDVILLSPACASFDLFDNYKHRGDRFKEEIIELNRKLDSNK